LVAGGTGLGSLWNSVVPFLSDSFTVVTYDQRGSGETPNPAGAFEISDLATDAARLIAALGYERAHVWGSSYGGAIAQELALRHPNFIDRLILSVTFTSYGALNEMPPDRADIIRRSGTDATAFGEMVKLYLSPGGQADPKTVARTSKAFSDAPVSAEQGVRRREALMRFDTGNRIQDIDVNTWVIGAKDDFIVDPVHSWTLARTIPSAGFLLLPDMGHALAVEDPARAARAVKQILLPKT
jgi:3-oxoadipate enol-lactonase